MSGNDLSDAMTKAHSVRMETYSDVSIALAAASAIVWGAALAINLLASNWPAAVASLAALTFTLMNWRLMRQVNLYYRVGHALSSELVNAQRRQR